MHGILNFLNLFCYSFIKTHLTDDLERNVRDFISFLRGFESFNIRLPHILDPSWVYHSPVCFPTAVAILNSWPNFIIPLVRFLNLGSRFLNPWVRFLKPQSRFLIHWSTTLIYGLAFLILKSAFLIDGLS